ncbi:ABC transporter permease [Roseomonas marmotae]|uniref:ABC transporter permease n=2 Tax=Roseomonas marmotae TaxID=2768161 RepID=A0ABS3KH26_9PROT|nr:ABC transporter permease [Roseomonas marmotae]MBO1075918.1 ABC transporter permease [Roseomonas marmotae]
MPVMPVYRPRRMVLAACMLGGLMAQPALAQAPMLYEQRLPDDLAFIRIINALPGSADITSDIMPGFTVGDGEADRIGPYVPAEKATGQETRFRITEGGEELSSAITFEKGYNTLILLRQEGKLTAMNLPDSLEFNQLRARLAFYNLIPGCGDGALTLEGSNQAIFTGVAPYTTKARSVNPAAASLRASCQGQQAPVRDLGRLEAGGQYSIWLMAPQGQPITVLARDRIAPRR